MSTEVKVPVLGESITEATLGQWLKKPGEPVAVDEPIASLETDKVAVEVPSPVAGIMGAYAVEEGATVNVGAVIGSIDAGTGAAAAPVAASAVAPAVTSTAAPRRPLLRKIAICPCRLRFAVWCLSSALTQARSRARARMAA